MPIFSTLDRLSTLSKDYDGSGLSPLSCCCCDWFAVHKHKVLELPDWKDHTGKGLRLQVAGCRLQGVKWLAHAGVKQVALDVDTFRTRR